MNYEDLISKAHLATEEAEIALLDAMRQAGRAWAKGAEEGELQRLLHAAETGIFNDFNLTDDDDPTELFVKAIRGQDATPWDIAEFWKDTVGESNADLMQEIELLQGFIEGALQAKEPHTNGHD